MVRFVPPERIHLWLKGPVPARLLGEIPPGRFFSRIK